jgi:hypothetical protein
MTCYRRSATGIIVSVLLSAGCSSVSQSPADASSMDVHDEASGDSSDGPPSSSPIDGSALCSYPAGGAPLDGGAFKGGCPTGGCPAGKICVSEIGGVGEGGGAYCAPIPNECHGTPTCACMASCVCTNGSGSFPETCRSQQAGTITCDNGVR